MSQDLIVVVDKLFDALSHRNLDDMLALYADDILFELVLENVTAQGKKLMKKNAEDFLAWVEDGKKEILRCCQDNSSVWIERIDHWKIEGKWIALPIVAIIDFNSAGKIHRWREYHTLNYRKQFDKTPKTGFSE